MRWMVASVLVAGLLEAQERPRMRLSLGQAVEIALAPAGSPRVALARELIEQAEARQGQARAALLPQVDGSYTFRSFTQNLQAFGLGLDPRFAGIVPSFVGPVDVNDVRGTASQSVFDWSLIKRYQASKTMVEAIKKDAGAVEAQTAAQVARTYLAAQRADAGLETARANVALGERLVRLARGTKEAGTGLGIDVTRAEVQLAGSRQQVVQAGQDRESARLHLFRAMGLDMNADVELADGLAYKPVELPDAAKAVETARGNRLETQAQAEREKSARLNWESVRAERLPSVAAFGDYGVIGLVDGAMLPTRAVGVNVKIPLFDGGRRDARRAETVSQLRQEGIRTRDVRQQVELEVRLALEALKSAENQAQVARDALRLTEKELEQAERRYEAGVTTNVEVTDAQARLVRARENEVLARYRHAVARVDLHVAMGQVAEVLN